MKNFFNLKEQKGITLIALVITIIVLLILAGITIATLTGENGIITRASGAKAETIDKAKLDIIEWQTEHEGNITEEKVKEIIASYDKDGQIKNDRQDEEGTEYEYIETKKGGYEIKISEIWIGNGKIEEGKISWTYTEDGKITNGKITLQIGDYIDYNHIPVDYDEINKPYTDELNYTSPTGTQNSQYAYAEGTIEQGNGYSYSQSFCATKYTGKWRVLGIDNGEITKLKSTYYYYYPNSLTTSNIINDNDPGISTTSAAYDMIFKDSNGDYRFIWLASPFVGVSDEGAEFGWYTVFYGAVSGVASYVSSGNVYSDECYVCPVVSLESNIELEANGDNNWTIK